jgi:tripartite-type tricarboxylate transporter receptor subunit TctC
MKPMHILAAAALTSLLAGPGLAQDYPTKPIKLVVPFPPGRGTDVVSRVIAQKLGEATGWTIVVDNKPGSGGSVGLGLAGKAPADGYTIVMAQNANLVINPILGQANYDPIKDFAPIGLSASAPQVLVVAKAQALPDLMGGRVDIYVSSVPSSRRSTSSRASLSIRAPM